MPALALRLAIPGTMKAVVCLSLLLLVLCTASAFDCSKLSAEECLDKAQAHAMELVLSDLERRLEEAPFWRPGAPTVRQNEIAKVFEVIAKIARERDAARQESCHKESSLWRCLHPEVLDTK